MVARSNGILKGEGVQKRACLGSLEDLLFHALLPLLAAGKFISHRVPHQEKKDG